MTSVPTAPPVPPPPSARKKRKKWPLILLAIVAVIVVIIVATKKGGSSTAAPVAGQPAASALQTAPGIGVPARDGKFEFVVKSVQPGQPEIGTSPMTIKAQGEFQIVTVQVTNIGDQAQAFSGSDSKALDASGKEFSASTSAAIYLPDSQSLYEPINPGNQVTGQVVFDVPTGTKLVSIELHDSMFSNGISVQL